MLKKIISLMIAFAMLVPFSSAVAADENASQPTIEEILNGYHEKAFAAQAAGETGGAATYSRSSSSEKTLEQETVDELTAAGYEAYNVTADNYEELEASLRTDFSQLGIDPEGSYIVVISGEEESATSNSSRSSDVLLPPHIGGEEGGNDNSSFTYEYNDVTYRMRYVTITNADMSNDEMFRSSTAILSDINRFDEIAEVLADGIISIAAEKGVKKLFEGGSEELVEEIPFFGTLCTIASLLIEAGEAAAENPLQYIDTDAWLFNAGTAWTCEFIEVYDVGTGYWYAKQCSSYANIQSSMYGPYVYDPETNGPKQLGGIVQSGTVYSTYYSDTNTRKNQAAQAYLEGNLLVDGTGDIEYYFSNPIDPKADDVLIFLHEDIVISNP